MTQREQMTPRPRRIAQNVKVMVLKDERFDLGWYGRTVYPDDYPIIEMRGTTCVFRFLTDMELALGSEVWVDIEQGRNVPIAVRPTAKHEDNPIGYRLSIDIIHPSKIVETGSTDRKGRPVYKLADYGMIGYLDPWTDTLDRDSITSESPLIAVFLPATFTVLTFRRRLVELIAEFMKDGRGPDVAYFRDECLLVPILMYEEKKRGRLEPTEANPHYRLYRERVNPVDLLKLSCKVPSREELQAKYEAKLAEVEQQWGDLALDSYLHLHVIDESTKEAMTKDRQEINRQVRLARLITEILIEERERHITDGIPMAKANLAAFRAAAARGEKPKAPPALPDTTGEVQLSIEEMARRWRNAGMAAWGAAIAGGDEQAADLGQRIYSATFSEAGGGVAYPPERLPDDLLAVVNLLDAAQTPPELRWAIYYHCRVDLQERDPETLPISNTPLSVAELIAKLDEEANPSESEGTTTGETTLTLAENPESEVSFIIDPEAEFTPPPAAPTSPTLQEQWELWRVAEGIGKDHLPKLMAIGVPPEAARLQLLAYNAEPEGTVDPLIHLESGLRTRVAKKLLK